ncbi:hypothetical protein RHSIM_Rhsim05G0219400 [Rhododendron simsii]|uniref:Uncharacterized protein n=1 Tax=Rhododendron simsii TaxID=118357 RepID=A0A834H2T9_RHOSS|nr:hypothetical protein RHSIM_Rhsim05G0219400 [Rhododendron simsii]
MNAEKVESAGAWPPAPETLFPIFLILVASSRLSFLNSLDKSGFKSSEKVLIAFKPQKGKYVAFDGREMNAEEAERFLISVRGP